MSHQLRARDSTYWIHNNQNKNTVGPGSYENQAVKTGGNWNTNPAAIAGGDSKGVNSAMDSHYTNNPKSEMGKRQLIPFNSKIDRDEPDRISM